MCVLRDWRLDQHRRPLTANFLADVNQSKIQFVKHHEAHAYATYLGLDEAAILIVDGQAAARNKVFSWSGNDITYESADKIGIGLLYASVTDAIKFGFSQEGKTMGLAPYGGGLLDGGAMLNSMDFMGSN